ncbi:MAG: DNA alkylation repair protein [Candidatus Heimdallarchaeaceae archaeon]
MENQKEIAELIYNHVSREDIRGTIDLISLKLENAKTEKIQLTKTPVLNAIGKELGKLLLKEERKFERLRELWKNGKREEKLIVISALGWISKKDYENSKRFLALIIKDLEDWEICDQLALRVVVNLAVHNQAEIFSLMYQWLQSENKWIRRLAIATIPPYIRAKRTEAKVCLRLLEKTMNAEDKDVKKAVGWALREITKKDPIAAFEFLYKWAKQKNNKNTAWIIKDGMKKLDKEKQEILINLLRENNA